MKDRFRVKSEKTSSEIKEILKEHGNKKVGEVVLSQIYQGMRGITGLVTETSLLDAQEGIRFRGYSIPELQKNFRRLKAEENHCQKDCFISCSSGISLLKKMWHTSLLFGKEGAMFQTMYSRL
jgi:hypothetical protein